jgi:hypothetical protein
MNISREEVPERLLKYYDILMSAVAEMEKLERLIPENNWEEIENNKKTGLKVHRRFVEAENLLLCRGESPIPCSQKILVDYLRDFESAKDFSDGLFVSAEILDSFKGNIRVSH